MLWTMYCLAKNPEIQDKLYNETQKVLGENGEITAENISKLTYVKAVLKEAFRYVSLGKFAHAINRDFLRFKN